MKSLCAVTLVAAYASFVLLVLLISSQMTRFVVAAYAALMALGIGPALVGWLVMPAFVALAGGAIIHFTLWADRQLPQERTLLRRSR